MVARKPRSQRRVGGTIPAPKPPNVRYARSWPRFKTPLTHIHDIASLMLTAGPTCRELEFASALVARAATSSTRSDPVSTTTQVSQPSDIRSDLATVPIVSREKNDNNDENNEDNDHQFINVRRRRVRRRISSSRGSNHDVPSSPGIVSPNQLHHVLDHHHQTNDITLPMDIPNSIDNTISCLPPITSSTSSETDDPALTESVKQIRTSFNSQTPIPTIETKEKELVSNMESTTPSATTNVGVVARLSSIVARLSRSVSSRGSSSPIARNDQQQQMKEKQEIHDDADEDHDLDAEEHNNVIDDEIAFRTLGDGVFDSSVDTSISFDYDTEAKLIARHQQAYRAQLGEDDLISTTIQDSPLSRKTIDKNRMQREDHNVENQNRSFHIVEDDEDDSNNINKNKMSGAENRPSPLRRRRLLRDSISNKQRSILRRSSSIVNANIAQHNNNDDVDDLMEDVEIQTVTVNNVVDDAQHAQRINNNNNDFENDDEHDDDDVTESWLMEAVNATTKLGSNTSDTLRNARLPISARVVLAQSQQARTSLGTGGIDMEDENDEPLDMEISDGDRSSQETTIQKRDDGNDYILNKRKLEDEDFDDEDDDINEVYEDAIDIRHDVEPTTKVASSAALSETSVIAGRGNIKADNVAKQGNSALTSLKRESITSSSSSTTTRAVRKVSDIVGGIAGGIQSLFQRQRESWTSSRSSTGGIEEPVSEEDYASQHLVLDSQQRPSASRVLARPGESSFRAQVDQQQRQLQLQRQERQARREIQPRKSLLSASRVRIPDKSISYNRQQQQQYGLPNNRTIANDNNDITPQRRDFRKTPIRASTRVPHSRVGSATTATEGSPSHIPISAIGAKDTLSNVGSIRNPRSQWSVNDHGISPKSIPNNGNKIDTIGSTTNFQSQNFAGKLNNASRNDLDKHTSSTSVSSTTPSSSSSSTFINTLRNAQGQQRSTHNLLNNDRNAFGSSSISSSHRSTMMSKARTGISVNTSSVNTSLNNKQSIVGSDRILENRTHNGVTSNTIQRINVTSTTSSSSSSLRASHSSGVSGGGGGISSGIITKRAIAATTAYGTTSNSSFTTMDSRSKQGTNRMIKPVVSSSIFSSTSLSEKFNKTAADYGIKSRTVKEPFFPLRHANQQQQQQQQHGKTVDNVQRQTANIYSAKNVPFNRTPKKYKTHTPTGMKSSRNENNNTVNTIVDEFGDLPEPPSDYDSDGVGMDSLSGTPVKGSNSILGGIRLLPQGGESGMGSMVRSGGGYSPRTPGSASRRSSRKQRGDKRRPEWALTPNLMRTLREQEHIDPDKIFVSAMPPLDELFRGSKARLDGVVRARKSSIWTRADELTEEEVQEYKERMHLV